MLEIKRFLAYRKFRVSLNMGLATMLASAFFLSLSLGSATTEAAAPAPSKATSRFEINYMKFSIDHHAQGIKMAQLCVQKATHQELRDLCQMNIQTQTQEINELQSWLKSWYGVNYQPQTTAKDRKMLEQLSRLSGSQFEIQFMLTFSEHHATIIERSTEALLNAYHPELLDLAKNIIMAQATDIRKMRGWLCDWYGVCDPANHKDKGKNNDSPDDSNL